MSNQTTIGTDGGNTPSAMEPAAVGSEHVDLTACPVRLANTKAWSKTFPGCRWVPIATKIRPAWW